MHQNEYVAEGFNALQLSPTLRVTADLQFLWNPAFNPTHSQAAALQIQLVLDR